MRLRRLSEILNECPGFEVTWRSEDEFVVLGNPKYGIILHGAVCDDSGRPMYDLPLWAERVGAIVVPVDEEGRIAILEQERPVPVSIGGFPQFPPGDLSGQGIVSLELPRGFPDPEESPEQTAKREVEEETGRRVKEIIYLGKTNSNTSYYLNNNFVYLARLTSDPEDLSNRDSSERIYRVRYPSLTELLNAVALGEMICGLSKSALLMYVAWLHRQGLKI